MKTDPEAAKLLPMKIFQQIPKVMIDIEAIGKDSYNQQQGFKFRSVDSIYNELHAVLAKHGVFTVPEVLESERSEKPTKSGGVLTYTIAKIKFTFFADDGSNVSAVVLGEGSDSGDKSSNKAMAVAHKYAFVQVFTIPTEDDKDPDGYSHEQSSEPLKLSGAPAPIKPIGAPTSAAWAPGQNELSFITVLMKAANVTPVQFGAELTRVYKKNKLSDLTKPEYDDLVDGLKQMAEDLHKPAYDPVDGARK